MIQKFNVTLFARLLLAFITLSLVLCLTGCYTQKKAQKSLLKAQMDYPYIVAKNCAAWYAQKDSVITNTEYISGEEVYVLDTFFVDCDSVVNVTNNKNILRDNLGPSWLYKSARGGSIPPPATNKIPFVNKNTKQVDTFTRTEFRFTENTARVDALGAELEVAKVRINQLSAELTLAHSKRKRCARILAVLIAYILAKILLRLFVPQFNNITKNLP